MTPTSELRTWTLQIGQRAPLTLNGQRRSPYAHARVAVELHYAPRDRRRRDPMNLVATLKPVEDGIVDAGVIPDDTPQYSQPVVPVIDPPTGQPGRLYVIIRELEATDA